MERLTKRTKTGGVLMASEYEEKYTAEEWICMLQDRLADYEDSGVTPERVVWMKEVIEIAFDHDKSRVERAHELHVADKEGRVVILPCKRGDGIYICSAGRAWRFWVTDVSTLNGRTVLNVQGFGTIAADDIGKTAFLSFEEAERALEERKNV